MANKRTYTTMNSDTIHINDSSNTHNHSITKQPPSKRRRINKNNNHKSNNTLKTNTNSINSPQKYTKLNLNLNINHNNNYNSKLNSSNHNQKYQEQSDDENLNNNPKPTNHTNTKNLNQKRITTPINNTHFTSDFTHTPQSAINNLKYLQQKQRILTQTPSPITSPESSTSLQNQLQLTDTSSNTNSNQSDIEISRRKIKFEDEINNEIYAQNNIIAQKQNPFENNENKSPSVDNKSENDSFDTAQDLDEFNACYGNIFESDRANGIPLNNNKYMKILNERKAFRNYVLSNLNDDKEYAAHVCFILGVLFLFVGLINLYLQLYDSMNILLSLMVVINILNDLRNCRGECGLSLIVISMFLVRKLMEFMYMKYYGNIEWNKELINDLFIYLLLLWMLCMFVLNEFYWNAIQERIFNRGMVRRMVCYIIYFWFNAYLVMELVVCLCVNEGNEGNDYISIRIIVMYGFGGIVTGLWFKLQDIKYIEIEQFKLNEIIGFMLLIWMNYVLCFGFLEEQWNGKDGFMDKEYILIVLIAILLLHKFFYL